jgi:hypothetical protein
MILSRIFQLLVYEDEENDVDGDNLLGRNMNTIKKNTVALLYTSKEVELDVNAEFRT